MSSTDQISKIRINDDFLCDIFLESLNPDEDLSSGSYENIFCGVSSEIPAGLYNLTFKTDLGNPFNHYHSYQISADGSQKYQVMVKPEVESVNSNEGSVQG
jgi:hypothetical protein